MCPSDGDNRRRAAKRQAQAIIDAASAALGRGGITDAEWQRRVTDALAQAYLGENDPRWQSGFDGDDMLWREARELVLLAMPRDGSLLDVGCANGHLMECIEAWAEERGQGVRVFGLELNEDLARVARARLPALADRIFTGNVSDWTPPHRFTYVRTGLEYVPPGRESALVARLMRDVVERDGRLVIGPISESDVDATTEAMKAAGVTQVGVETATDRNGKTRYVVWAEREPV